MQTLYLIAHLTIIVDISLGDSMALFFPSSSQNYTSRQKSVETWDLQMCLDTG